jgi:hypothetical protein
LLPGSCTVAASAGLPRGLITTILCDGDNVRA